MQALRQRRDERAAASSAPSSDAARASAGSNDLTQADATMAAAAGTAPPNVPPSVAAPAQSRSEAQAMTAAPPLSSYEPQSPDDVVSLPFSGAVAFAGLLLAGVRLGRSTAEAEQMEGRSIDDLLQGRLRDNAQAQQAAAADSDSGQRIQDAKAKVPICCVLDSCALASWPFGLCSCNGSTW